MTSNLPNRQKKDTPEGTRSDDGGVKKPAPEEDASMNSSDKPRLPPGSLALEIIQELQEESVLPMEG